MQPGRQSRVPCHEIVLGKDCKTGCEVRSCLEVALDRQSLAVFCYLSPRYYVIHELIKCGGAKYAFLIPLHVMCPLQPLLPSEIQGTLLSVFYVGFAEKLVPCPSPCIRLFLTSVQETVLMI
ncbi:hypothetical protein L6452_39251 [Arctium lappa]|uniref:Uncharacterized protein n=1 Tax=Arctium lappa TaxID=4217 RepID=A0ACB8XSG4_ARCLA|nr:hypothetical protein L6452_39251 [Arctium lappa]